jgi:acetyl-CoA acetyltransferase family protein
MNPRPVIVEGVRTPFCKAGTELAALAADELGRVAVNALLTRTGLDPRLVDEVIFGCVAQPADAANVARVIALRAGIPKETPAFTVHRNCASGCEAVTQACDKIAAGRGEIYVVGGVESMSQIPLLFRQAASKKFTALGRAKSAFQKLAALAAFRPSDFSPLAGLKLGLSDPVCGLNMGQTAELLAREWNISREEEDSFALESHRRATAAAARLAEEISPVYLNRGSKSKPVAADNGPRRGQTMEALAKLRPVFEPETGVVTAGNSSQISDGAAALLVMSDSNRSGR